MSLFQHHHTFLRRISMAKTMGILIGGFCAFLIFPWYFESAPFLTSIFQWGVFLWWITFSAIIGLAGLVTECPFLGKKFPLFTSHIFRPILRGGFIGMWLNIVLYLLMYDKITDILAYSQNILLENLNIFIVFALKGFFWGAIIDFVATKFGGEGKEILN